MTVEDSPLRCFSLLVFVCLTEFASDQDVEETLSWLFTPVLHLSLPPSSDSSTKLFTSKESYLVGQRQTPELQATVSLLLLVKLTYLKTKSLLWGHFSTLLNQCRCPVPNRHPENLRTLNVARLNPPTMDRSIEVLVKEKLALSLCSCFMTDACCWTPKTSSSAASRAQNLDSDFNSFTF